jgi:hypothetical protein
MAENFAAEVSRHVLDYKGRLEGVFQQSAQDLIAQAQQPVAQGGRMPVDTGFLRNSLVSGLNGSTALSGADSYVMAIAGAEPGDTIHAYWTASYARYVEYGAQGRPGRFFARGAAQDWQRIVKENVAKVKR